MSYIKKDLNEYTYIKTWSKLFKHNNALVTSLIPVLFFLIFGNSQHIQWNPFMVITEHKIYQPLPVLRTYTYYVKSKNHLFKKQVKALVRCQRVIYVSTTRRGHFTLTHYEGVPTFYPRSIWRRNIIATS